jgi:L-alanine-DL-glutamate epimerase-like enolase superfamily enzyme
MQISCYRYDLTLRDPFTISRGTVCRQPTMIVRVEHDGLEGLGEATTNEYYGATFEGMVGALQQVADRLHASRLENPAEIWQDFDDDLRGSRFAQCALDCALWDLYAKMHQLPLWQLWGLHDDEGYPPSCYTIGIATVEEMVRKMKEMPEWGIYKIKLDASGGMDLVRRLRQETTSIFRVDANCSWAPAQVLDFADQLAAMEVELIEQPLAATEYQAMSLLKGQSPLPLMADESCQEEKDIDLCIPAFDAVNIKLVKCGGLTPARRMIARAKQNGLKVMVGCMTESSIGISAGVHLLPLLDFADLDGALLLATDIAEGLNWKSGFCELPKSHGLGVSLIEADRERLF